MGCDYYASNCYKWMLGPIGTGFLYVSEEARQGLKPLLRPHDPEAGAAQYVTSTPAYALYAGVAATIDLMESFGGVEAIQRESARKAEALKASLDAVPGVLVLSSRRPDSQTGTVTFAIEGVDGGQVSTALKDRWQIVQRATYLTDPSGVRISVAFYISEAELSCAGGGGEGAGGGGGTRIDSQRIRWQRRCWQAVRCGGQVWPADQ